MQETMTIRVDVETKQRLEKLAAATARTKSYLAAEAIRVYLDVNEWQIQEIEATVREADAAGPDEFIPHDTVKEWLHSWGTKRERKTRR
jgi:predicted transcriptional regulator